MKEGVDEYGNAGASSYGKNIIEIILPINDIKITNGEIQYIGESKSLENGSKYPIEIYKAFNDYYGSNYTSEEIDKMEFKDVRDIASIALSGGRDEFDTLISPKAACRNIKKADNLYLLDPNYPDEETNPQQPKDNVVMKDKFKTKKKRFRNEPFGIHEQLQDGMSGYRDQFRGMGTENGFGLMEGGPDGAGWSI